MQKDLVSPQGLRVDGRRANELRRFQATSGIIERADGSSYVEMGNTKVLASVYGPMEPKGRALHDKALFTVEYQVSSFASNQKMAKKVDRRNLDTAEHVKQALDPIILLNLFPRSQIECHIQVLQEDGSVLACAINALSLALVDAGIPMKEMVVACSAGSVKDSSTTGFTTLLDLNKFEEGAGEQTPLFTMAMALPQSEKVTMVHSEKRMHISRLETISQMCKNGCVQIADLLKKEVTDRSRERAARFKE